MGSEANGRPVSLGAAVSEWTSRLFAHPWLQVAVLIFCGLWFWVGFNTDLLTAGLSILAITLAQMVLNGQYRRESEAHRRDLAMHAKLDELIKATKRARDEMAGIEELEEEEIAELREDAKAAIDAQGERAGDPQERAVAKAAVDQVTAKAARKAG